MKQRSLRKQPSFRKLTKIVPNLYLAAGGAIAVAKDAVVNPSEGSQGDGLDDRGRDDGYDQQDESCEQQDRQRGRRPQHHGSGTRARV